MSLLCAHVRAGVAALYRIGMSVRFARTAVCGCAVALATASGSATTHGQQLVSGGGVVSSLPGSIGTDRSGNAPAGPGSASSFVFNGATMTLLATAPANASRNAIEVNNTTGSVGVVVIDDGNNGNVSLFPLAPGMGQFQQGGDWQSISERGQVRFYGIAGSFVYMREN